MIDYEDQLMQLGIAARASYLHSMGLERPLHWVELPERDQTAWIAAGQAIIRLLDRDGPDHESSHFYMSTGCLHDNHAYCQSKTYPEGSKEPAKCKFCDARCLCICHVEMRKEDDSAER